MPDKDGSYDDQAFWAQIQADSPTLLAFWNHNCAPCKVMAPVFERVGKRFKRRIEFIAVNVYDRPDIARKFAVASTPTFLVVRNGKAVRRLSGVMHEQTLSGHLEGYALPIPAAGVDEPGKKGLLASLLRFGRAG